MATGQQGAFLPPGLEVFQNPVISGAIDDRTERENSSPGPRCAERPARSTNFAVTSRKSRRPESASNTPSTSGRYIRMPKPRHPAGRRFDIGIPVDDNGIFAAHLREWCV